jgi:hypothetical protein
VRLRTLRARYERYDIADTDDADDTLSLLEIPTVGQEHKQSYGRPFVTDGNTVAVVAFVVAGTEITLFVVVLQLRGYTLSFLTYPTLYIEYMEAVQLCSNLAREV